MKLEKFVGGVLIKVMVSSMRPKKMKRFGMTKVGIIVGTLEHWMTAVT